MGQFLAGDPSYVQYDADIIKNLGLPLQVVSTGSEQAELAALDAAISRGEPLLMYLWTPHSVHAKHPLTEVQLPAYSEDCYAKAEAGGIDCDYPPDVLLKVMWAELDEQAPDAATFLKNFQLTNEDQIQMLGAVEVDGQSVEAAAQAWVDANESTWRAWLP
jgi:glycine betaine/proline transport system substrate-binding protein